MASFNAPFEWNNNLQSSLTSLDENDFMMLLQKQFPMIGGIPVQPTDLTKSKVDMGGNTTPATAQPPNTTSPLSSDSSPSPPSAQDDTGSLHSVDGNNNQAGGSNSRPTRTEEDTHKRKASVDDFEIQGQPSSKSQHIDSARKAHSRRKSGERVQDESRLMKRKEQNRAAQRAFRERKEKHVKDLEDRVAQLEAQTESQAAENENLRDMLSRLQNENAVLKQTPFTFSVPNGITADQRSPQPSTSSMTAPGLFSSTAEAGPSRVRANTASSATPSSHDSPDSMFGRFENYSNINSPASPSRSNTISTNTSGTTTTPDLDAMTYFGSTGPFHTIASNPMFTSYYDPIQSMNAFASFGGWDKWDTDTTMANTTTTSPPSDNNQGLDGLFGDQFSNLIPLSQDFLNPDVSVKANTPGPLGNGGGLSPVAHHNSNNSMGAGTSHNGDECPKTKADVERMIAQGPKGTFGAPVALSVKENNGTSSPVENNMQVEPNEYDVAFQEALGKAGKMHQNGLDTYNIDDLCLEMQRKAKCSLGDC